MTFLWMPLVQNTLQVQALGSCVRSCTGLRCEIVDEMQEIKDDTTQGISYEFEAQLTTSSFCSGPVTFVVPTETPELPYNMYEAEFSQDDSAWYISVRQAPAAMCTFPTAELFPDFSLPSPAALKDSVGEQHYDQDLCKISVATPQVGNDTPAIPAVEVVEDDRRASSETSDQNKTSSVTGTSTSWADIVEEDEEEEHNAVTVADQPVISLADKTDEQNEEALLHRTQEPQPSVESPEPPTVLSVDVSEQDDIELIDHGDETVTETATNDRDVFQTMINELEDPWNANLRAFVPEDTTEAYNCYFDQVDPNDPRQPDQDSRKWHQLCKFNAEWWFMTQASERIKAAYQMEQPYLRHSGRTTRPQLPLSAPSDRSKLKTASPESEIHHYNLLGRHVEKASSTPIEVSFWATHSTALIKKKYSILRHHVCAAQAATWVDPFHVATLVEAWDGSRWLTGSALERAATGKLKRVYHLGGTWRNPEDALAPFDVPHVVDWTVVPAVPVIPPVIDDEVNGDIVVNDDGRVHPVTISTRERPARGPSSLRIVELCYEDDEVTQTKRINDIVQPLANRDGIAKMFLNEPSDSASEGDDEDPEPVIAASIARPPTRRMLRVCSPRMRRTPKFLSGTNRNQEHQGREFVFEDDISEAETEIITDTHPSASANHIVFTCEDKTSTNDHVLSGTRVSEWIDTFTGYQHSEVASSEYLNDSQIFSPTIETIPEEDEFLQRLSREKPQGIFTLDDSDSENESSFNSGEYSPKSQSPYSPITDSSAYNDEADAKANHEESFGFQNEEHDDSTTDDDISSNLTTCEDDSIHTVDRQEQENVTTELVLYRGPVTLEELLSQVNDKEAFHINSLAIRSAPFTFFDVRPHMKSELKHREVRNNQKTSSTVLVLYQGPVASGEDIRYVKREDRHLPPVTSSEPILTNAQPNFSAIISRQVNYPIGTIFGQKTITAKQQHRHTLSSTSALPIMRLVAFSTNSAPKTSQATPILNKVDISSIPIIPYNDISEIPQPAPSAAEKFYGKINIAIGRAAIKAWNFLSLPSYDWSVNMGLTGNDDGYLWERNDSV